MATHLGNHKMNEYVCSAELNSLSEVEDYAPSDSRAGLHLSRRIQTLVLTWTTVQILEVR